jgi:hypothetical protein
MLRAAPGPGPGTCAEGGGKKRRGHDERNLAHQGSQATFFLVGRMRATSAGSCDAGGSGVEFRGALRLEDSGNSSTLITVDALLRYA